MPNSIERSVEVEAVREITTVRPTVGRNPARSIGAILLDAGLLQPADADRVLAYTRQHDMRFGAAAVKLGLVTQADIDRALSNQFEYSYLIPGSSRVSREVVAAYEPSNPVTEDLRGLRSQLLLRWFKSDEPNRMLAVTGNSANEGMPFVASNLAVVFSQLGERTLLIDANMRNPVQHTLFGLDNRFGLSSVLTGRNEREALYRIDGLRDLTVMPAGGLPPNPQELLSRDAFGALLERVATGFDVVIVDTPPVHDSLDAHLIAARTKGAVLVVKQDESRVSEVRGLVQALSDAGSTVVGTVLKQ